MSTEIGVSGESLIELDGYRISTVRDVATGNDTGRVRVYNAPIYGSRPVNPTNDWDVCMIGWKIVSSDGTIEIAKDQKIMLQGHLKDGYHWFTGEEVAQKLENGEHLYNTFSHPIRSAERVSDGIYYRLHILDSNNCLIGGFVCEF